MLVDHMGHMAWYTDDDISNVEVNYFYWYQLAGITMDNQLYKHIIKSSTKWRCYSIISQSAVYLCNSMLHTDYMI